MDLRKLLPRRKEKRSTTSIMALIGQGDDLAGDPVTEISIEWLPAVQRALNLISSDVARLPMRIVSSTSDGSKIEQHGPTSKLLNDWPTQALHSHAWRRHIVREYLVHGNAFCYIQKSGRGEPLQLVPLDSGSVSLDWSDGTLVYVHTELGRLAPSEVLHFRMPGGPHGLCGNGLLVNGREALSQMRSQQRVAASVAANTVQPRVVLKHPGKLSEQVAAQAKSKFMQTFSGNGSGGTVLLQDGMSVETLSVKVTDLDFIATCAFSIGEVSRLTGVPLTMLSELSHSTFSNVVELNRSYIDTCLSMHLSMISAEIRAKLLPTTRYLEFDTTVLTRGTLGDQVAAWGKALEIGVLTRNEMRTRLGLNPIEGLDAPTLRLDTAEVDDEEDIEDIQIDENEDLLDEQD